MSPKLAGTLFVLILVVLFLFSIGYYASHYPVRGGTCPKCRVATYYKDSSRTGGHECPVCGKVYPPGQFGDRGP
jgi:hypothetical protein